MRTPFVLCVSVASPVLAGVLAAQTPYLVKDIAVPPPGASSNPSGFEELGANVLFAADGFGTGVELYASGGTFATTAVVKDINPGAADSSPQWLTTIGKVCYFSAVTAAQGREIWKSDGTASGTVLLKDIIPGKIASDPKGFTLFGKDVYFVLGDTSFDLWKTDGTANGTTLVKRIAAKTSGYGEVVMAASNGLLYFDGGSGLWVSDGSANGTKRLATERPMQIETIGADTYVVDRRRNITRYTRTGATRIYTPVLSATDLRLAAVGQELFCEEKTTYWSGPRSWSVFKLLRVTATGTTLVQRDRRIFGTVGSTLYLWDFENLLAYASGRTRTVGKLSVSLSMPNTALALGNLFFRPEGQPGLHAVNLQTGVSAVLTRLRLPSSLGSRFAVTGTGRFLFAACDASNDCELYGTDGTPANTGLVKNIHSGPGNRNPSSSPRGFHASGGLVYFQATTPATGSELFVTDGTAAGTRLLMDIESGTGSSSPWQFTQLGDTVLFTAYTSPTGYEVWITDGTPGGTRLLKDLQTGPFGPPLHLTRVGPYVYFTAVVKNGYPHLIRTDGTANGTVVVTSLENLLRQFDPHLAAAGNYAFLAAHERSSGVEPYRIDGARMTRVADLRQGVLGSNPGPFWVAGDRVYFLAESPGWHLFWVPVDGGRVQSVVASTAVWHGTAFGNRFLYWGWDGSARTMATYITDGTGNGTIRLPVSTTETSRSDLSEFGFVGSRAIVHTRRGLFTTDGTVANTRSLQTFAFSRRYPFFMVGQGRRKVFFPAETAAAGIEMWSSDGTAAGTRMVADIHPGASHGLLDGGGPVIADGRLFFAADNGTQGAELWAIDLGATAEGVGLGCSASGRVPILSATDPILGKTMAIHLDYGPKNRSGFFFVGAPSRRVHDLSGGCSIYLDFTLPTLVAVLRTDAAGHWSQGNLALPNDNSLKGVRLHVQTALGPTAKPPLGADLSNGVRLVLDSR